jgi:hypothetical protein
MMGVRDVAGVFASTPSGSRVEARALDRSLVRGVAWCDSDGTFLPLVLHRERIEAFRDLVTARRRESEGRA